MDQLSVEESIKRLKAEIIAQDWRISQKRAEMIQGALHCLQDHFQSRKATHAMLIMAMSVLDYIKRRGGTPPETVDFLKEAMAHVVEQFEDLEYDPKREERTFQALFTRFKALKGKIKTGGKLQTTNSSQPTPQPARPSIIKEKKPAAPNALEPTAKENLLQSIEAEQLINDLRSSLEKAGEAGSTIGLLLGQLLESHKSASSSSPVSPHKDFPPLTAKIPNTSLPTTETKTLAQKIREDSSHSSISEENLQSCPPTDLRHFMIGSISLAVQENLVAAVQSMRPSKMASYLQAAEVPAKDFGSLFGSLSKRFKGSLGTLKPRKIRGLSLPIMVPRGLDLPDTSSPQGKNILVLSNGSWHGIIICDTIEATSGKMIKFQKRQNGDIAGRGFLEDAREVQLLDSLTLLRREGFLVVPS